MTGLSGAAAEGGLGTAAAGQPRSWKSCTGAGRLTQQLGSCGTQPGRHRRSAGHGSAGRVSKTGAVVGQLLSLKLRSSRTLLDTKIKAEVQRAQFVGKAGADQTPRTPDLKTHNLENKKSRLSPRLPSPAKRLEAGMKS
ncbi:hypothetical protein NDU88_005993 [Pleurodeles waltl]|uniref:Uncharacterized protein n=1 Tax=Pleurodeles waltl TaxID=8319 RepID=A0AAV7PJM4_PLEWA|nr:hypothetical protein NDU88_005993 [Pleurodeles waltl]